MVHTSGPRSKMGNLIPEDLKNSIRAAFDDIHDTFSREINIFQSDSNYVYVSTDPSFNPIYNIGESGQTDRQNLVKISGKARIQYAPNQKLTNSSQSIGLAGLYWPDGSIRLKITEDIFKIIKNAKKIEVDGELCELDSTAARTGPFTANYFIIFLKRSD